MISVVRKKPPRDIGKMTKQQRFAKLAELGTRVRLEKKVKEGREQLKTTLRRAVHGLREKCILRQGITLVYGRRRRSIDERLCWNYHADSRTMSVLIKGAQINGGQKKQFKLETAMDIAYDQIVARNDVAKKYQCDPGTVVHFRELIAEVYRRHEVRLADFSEQWLQSACRPNDSDIFTASFSIDRWDETKECLSLGVNRSLSAKQQQQGWHSLISDRRVTFARFSMKHGFVDGLNFPCIVPAVPCINTSCGTLYDGLEMHPSSAIPVRLRTAGGKHTRYAFLTEECDGASSNDKFCHYRYDQLGESLLPAKRRCGNHNNNLVELSVLTFVGMYLLHGMYSICLLLRHGGGLLRLIHVAEDAVQTDAILRVEIKCLNLQTVGFIYL